MKLSDQVRAEAGPVHHHTSDCPPDCQAVYLVPSGPLTPGPGPDGLPQVLWRVQLIAPTGAPGDRHRPRWFEVEGDAVLEIEDSLAEGYGLASVHRLDLYPSELPAGPGKRTAHYTWRELTYEPPARGRLIAKPS